MTFLSVMMKLVGVVLLFGMAGASVPEYKDKSTYSFAYEVVDPYSGQDFGHQETRYDDVVKGEYRVLLPDDRMQVVRYKDEGYGFIADVQYSGGKATYGDSSYGKGGNNKYPSGADSSYGNQHGSSNKYPDPSYGKENNKYPSSYGKDTSKYPDPSYGKDSNKYPEPSYGRDTTSKYPDPSYSKDTTNKYPEPSYGKDSSKYPDSSYGKDSNKYPDSSYGKEGNSYPTYGKESGKYPELGYGKDNNKYPEPSYNSKPSSSYYNSPSSYGAGGHSGGSVSGGNHPTSSPSYGTGSGSFLTSFGRDGNQHYQQPLGYSAGSYPPTGYGCKCP